MTLTEIKQAIENGQTVYWSNYAYKVIKDNLGQYLIHCQLNDNYWGLTWADGVTVNGQPGEFFISVEPNDIFRS